MNLPVLRRKKEVERSDPSIAFNDWVGLFTQFGFNGVQYTAAGQSQENIAPAFLGIARAAYKANGIVFACVTARQMLLSEARFCFRERRNGRPGNLFTDASLAPLETPWPGATTGDLISRMELFASLGGNWFGTNRYGGIRSLRPDWMTIILGSENDYETTGWDPDAVPVGYVYQPGGPGSGRDRIVFLPEEIAHYAPLPDPEAQFRGMSWLTPIIREVMADKAATDHKLMFFENGATPNLVVKMDVEDVQQWVNYIREFSSDHEGVQNAYKTMYLGAGMDASVVGANLQQMDFKVTQGAGETRIAAAARVPAAIAQISEGLQGSTLNSGNFDSSMRMFADLMARPTWRNMAGSLATLVPPPHQGSELWYDDRDIPALKEDIRKAGERIQADAASIASLVSTSGFTPESSVDAVTSGDFSRLVHSGLIPVQQQAPAAGTQPDSPAGNGNGNGNGPPVTNGSNGKRADDLLGELLVLSQKRDRPLEIHNHLPDQPPANIVVPVNVEAQEPQHITVEAARAPDVNVTVEPAVIEFGEGSVRLEAPITVEPANVTVEAARAPDVNVTVEPSQVTVEPAQVTVEAAPTPNVDVRVDAPPPAEVSVTVEPSTVTVEAARAPDVHVHVPEQKKPRKAVATREEDGSLTVRYEEEPDGS